MMKNNRLVFLTALLLSALILTSCFQGDSSGIVIAGSTSVLPFVEILAEEYAVLTGYKIDVQGGGSSAGVTAVQSGAAGIGMSSRNLRGAELELWSIEIAKDGLAIIVHPSNPVSDLTLEQVRRIYMGEIRNWSEVGGLDAGIHIIAREEGSGTRGAFDEMMMKGEKVTPRAITQNTNGTIRMLVSGDRNSIGFVSLGLVDHTVKALRLDGIEATRENVINGSYELFRPFIFITEEEPEGILKHFIDFVLSPEGRNILSERGLIVG